MASKWIRIIDFRKQSVSIFCSIFQWGSSNTRLLNLELPHRIFFNYGPRGFFGSHVLRYFPYKGNLTLNPTQNGASRRDPLPVMNEIFQSSGLVPDSPALVASLVFRLTRRFPTIFLARWFPVRVDVLLRVSSLLPPRRRWHRFFRSCTTGRRPFQFFGLEPRFTWESGRKDLVSVSSSLVALTFSSKYFSEQKFVPSRWIQSFSHRNVYIF